MRPVVRSFEERVAVPTMPYLGTLAKLLAPSRANLAFWVVVLRELGEMFLCWINFDLRREAESFRDKDAWARCFRGFRRNAAREWQIWKALPGEAIRSFGHLVTYLRLVCYEKLW